MTYHFALFRFWSFMRGSVWNVLTFRWYRLSYAVFSFLCWVYLEILVELFYLNYNAALILLSDRWMLFATVQKSCYLAFWDTRMVSKWTKRLLLLQQRVKPLHWVREMGTSFLIYMQVWLVFQRAKAMYCEKSCLELILPRYTSCLLTKSS